MSSATQRLASSLRVLQSARIARTQASTSRSYVRSYATPAGPSSENLPKDSNSREKRPEERPTAEQEVVPARNPGDEVRRSPASAFDIETSVSDLVAIQAAKEPPTTGARRQGASRKKQEKNFNSYITFLGGLSLVGSAFVLKNLGREWETIDEMEKYAADPSQDKFLTRAQLRLRSMYTSLQAPAWEKLLPDPLPFPYNRPYTLVVDLDDLLIHSEWTRATAWKTAKRPGLEYFLGYLSQWYEIVLFTKQPFYVVLPIIEKLDPDRRFFAYQLFRESCRTLNNGDVVKDLSALNRDLSKVIILDTDPTSVQLQPENAVVLEKWNGKGSDRDLIGMVDFLEAIGIYNIPDVRQTLKAYEGTHIPSEHAKRQAALQEQLKQEWKRKHQAKSSWIGSFSSATSKADVPKTFYELEKERYQQGYKEDVKYWRENGPILRQQAEEERQKQLKEMKMSPWGFLTGQGMPPAGQEQPAQQQP